MYIFNFYLKIDLNWDNFERVIYTWMNYSFVIGCILNE